MQTITCVLTLGTRTEWLDLVVSYARTPRCNRRHCQLQSSNPLSQSYFQQRRIAPGSVCRSMSSGREIPFLLDRLERFEMYILRMR